jgi:hypothetical protein
MNFGQNVRSAGFRFLTDEQAEAPSLRVAIPRYGSAQALFGAVSQFRLQVGVEIRRYSRSALKENRVGSVEEDQLVQAQRGPEGLNDGLGCCLLLGRRQRVGERLGQEIRPGGTKQVARLLLLGHHDFFLSERFRMWEYRWADELLQVHRETSGCRFRWTHWASSMGFNYAVYAIFLPIDTALRGWFAACE